MASNNIFSVIRIGVKYVDKFSNLSLSIWLYDQYYYIILLLYNYMIN